MRLNQGFVDKMQCCWENKLPDPFDSGNTRGNFFSQFLDMTAPGKDCINTPRYLTLIPGLRAGLGVPLMLRTGGAVRVFSFCLEPISINSILVILSVSLLAISHLLIFSKSVFKRD